jgi:hypothetical protein
MQKNTCAQIIEQMEKKKEQYLKENPHHRNFQDEINQMLDKSGNHRAEISQMLFASKLADLVTTIE